MRDDRPTQKNYFTIFQIYWTNSHGIFLKIIQMALKKTKEDISIYHKKRDMAPT